MLTILLWLSLMAIPIRTLQGGAINTKKGDIKAQTLFSISSGKNFLAVL